MTNAGEKSHGNLLCACRKSYSALPLAASPGKRPGADSEEGLPACIAGKKALSAARTGPVAAPGSGRRCGIIGQRQVPCLPRTFDARSCRSRPTRIGPSADRRCSRRPRRRSPTNATASRCIASCPRPSRFPRTKRSSSRCCGAATPARVPVVARGAGTSLSGGALPDKRGVVVAMAKFRSIVADRSGGVHGGRAARRAQSRDFRRRGAYGLYYAPDPSSQIACTIGGNVGENAGGVHCLKYGLTVHNVRRVRGVLITGEVVEFGGDALDSAGYDLLALIHGSEGLLAVTTEITVKLTPKPQTGASGARRVRRRRRRRARRSPPSSARASCPRGSR